MREENGSGSGMPAGAQGGLAESESIDWVAAERSPEFRELVTRRRRFVLPCTVFFLSWYFGFVILAGYAPEFMGESVYEGLTVGYVLALSQFVMVWGLGWWYLRKADSEFDPLARKAAQVAIDAGAGKPTGGSQPQPAAPRKTEEVAS